MASLRRVPVDRQARADDARHDAAGRDRPLPALPDGRALLRAPSRGVRAHPARAAVHRGRRRLHGRERERRRWTPRSGRATKPSIVFGGNVRARTPNVSSLLRRQRESRRPGRLRVGRMADGGRVPRQLGGRLIDNQFLGQALVAGIEGERGSARRVVAHAGGTTLLHRSAAGRVAGASRGVQRLMQLRSPDGTRPSVVAQPALLRRRRHRARRRARASRADRALAHRRRRGAGEPARGRRVGDRARPRSDADGSYTSHRIARLNLLLGVRDIHFVRRTGSMRSRRPRTCRSGSSSACRSDAARRCSAREEEDFFLAGDLYVGLSRSPHTRRACSSRARGVERSGEAAWDGVLTTGRLTHYVMFTPIAARPVALEWAGGYQQRTPFQLLLGVPEGGVRGYENVESSGRPATRRACGAALHVRRGAEGWPTSGSRCSPTPAVSGRATSRSASRRR